MSFDRGSVEGVVPVCGRTRSGIEVEALERLDGCFRIHWRQTAPAVGEVAFAAEDDTGGRYSISGYRGYAATLHRDARSPSGSVVTFRGEAILRPAVSLSASRLTILADGEPLAVDLRARLDERALPHVEPADLLKRAARDESWSDDERAGALAILIALGWRNVRRVEAADHEFRADRPGADAVRIEVDRSAPAPIFMALIAARQALDEEKPRR